MPLLPNLFRAHPVEQPREVTPQPEKLCAVVGCGAPTSTSVRVAMNTPATLDASETLSIVFPLCRAHYQRLYDFSRAYPAPLHSTAELAMPEPEEA